jgi:hypothetical protein
MSIFSESGKPFPPTHKLLFNFGSKLITHNKRRFYREQTFRIFTMFFGGFQLFRTIIAQNLKRAILINTFDKQISKIMNGFWV